MKLDIHAIKGQLEELNPTIKVKLNSHQNVATSIKETDMGFSISLNPHHFRSTKKLEEHLNFCRETIADRG
jgi:hypothetical protein